MTPMAASLEKYLTTRRSLGFKLERPGQLLHQFIAACDQAGQASITLEAALSWATQPAGADPSWWGARLAVVRRFARWQAVFDPATEVPLADLLPRRPGRADPYPYTDEDIGSLMDAARAMRNPLRAATYETVIGLLAVTGMRVGEAIALDRQDVHPDDGVLVVRAAKFGASREVALHSTTLAALHRYEVVRSRLLPNPSSPAFFLSVAGTRLAYDAVHRSFHRLVAEAGILARSPRCRPRIHDLRHRFAVVTLLRWYRAGENVDVRMPQLSTHLGHIEPAGTYWYLRAAPELLELAAQRLEAAQGGLP